MTDREELVRAIGEAILAEAKKWPELPGDRYGGVRRLAPMGATGDDLGRAVLAVVDAAGWRPPLPDSQTEWGWKPDPDEPDAVICSVDEQAARERVSKASYRKLARREVGPWTEAQP